MMLIGATVTVLSVIVAEPLAFHEQLLPLCKVTGPSKSNTFADVFTPACTVAFDAASVKNLVPNVAAKITSLTF